MDEKEKKAAWLKQLAGIRAAYDAFFYVNIPHYEDQVERVSNDLGALRSVVLAELYRLGTTWQEFAPVAKVTAIKVLRDGTGDGVKICKRIVEAYLEGLEKEK